MNDEETKIAKPPAKAPEEKMRSLAVLRPGRTGPRTKRGKQKSRHNAIQHAIFASGILRKRESASDYYALVNDLVDTLQPVGKLERILVEKLAMLVWRYRRLLQAEAAEIGSAVESIEHRIGDQIVQPALTVGLIVMAVHTSDDLAVGVALDFLKEMQDKIQQEGLHWARDEKMLRRLYGTKPTLVDQMAELFGESKEETTGPDIWGDLAKSYWELAGPGTERHDARPPKASSDRILAMIQEEIDRLDRLFDRFAMRSMQRRELETMSSLVPKTEVLERLQRYEGSLDRAFERTLAQLERLQRLRLGQPVPPELRVRLTR